MNEARAEKTVYDSDWPYAGNHGPRPSVLLDLEKHLKVKGVSEFGSKGYLLFTQVEM